MRCPSWRLKLQDAMQALAEAEAELVAGSRSEPADLSLRRDSAADMHIREARSDGHNPAGSCRLAARILIPGSSCAIRHSESDCLSLTLHLDEPRAPPSPPPTL